MWANLDQYTPPNKTIFETPKSTRNKVSHPLIELNCKYDQIKPKVAEARRAKTNRSAIIILKTEFASAATSTLKNSQNQYPPKHVIIAPICHITGHKVGVLLSV